MAMNYFGIVEKDGQLKASFQCNDAIQFGATKDGIRQEANPRTRFCTPEELAATIAIAITVHENRVLRNDPEYSEDKKNEAVADIQRLEFVLTHLENKVAETSPRKTPAGRIPTLEI